MATEQRRTTYSGRVQGVGFRATTALIATNYQISGYVRNLPNGEVEVVCQGEPREIDRFLEEIASQMNRYIVSCVSTIEAFPGESLSGFSIRY